MSTQTPDQAVAAAAARQRSTSTSTAGTNKDLPPAPGAPATPNTARTSDHYQSPSQAQSQSLSPNSATRQPQSNSAGSPNTPQTPGHSGGLPPLPAAPASRVYGQGYSGRHKVPTVSQYSSIKKDHEQQAQEYARQVEAQRAELGYEDGDDDEYRPPASPTSPTSPSSPKSTKGRKKSMSGKVKDPAKNHEAHESEGATEKQRMMDQMNAGKEKPTDRLRKAKHGERRVRDPITGAEIIVKDADPKDFDSHRPSPNGGNILTFPFPPPTPPSAKKLLGNLRQAQYLVAGGCAVLWFFVAFGSGWFRFFVRTGLMITFGFALMTLISLIEKTVERELDAVRMDMHRARGESMSPPYPESVEWLNGLIKLIWGLIDPTTFIPMADTVEDILQASLPGFVDAVRITDINQGSNPLRLLSIRALPDQPGDYNYPDKAWIDGGADLPLKDTTGNELEDEEAGDYYNFEVSFSYTALPGQNAREKNARMLIEFYLGAFDWFHIPVPIWIQIEEIIGIIRLRVQFIPSPPFVRNLTFALCGVPAIEVSAIPMSKKLPNVLDLPMISGFVKSGIAAGTSELCVPKSMTLNLKDMLDGSAVGDTRAIGAFIITVHFCEGLSAQDSNGKSDPYIVLAYAKYGRPLYSTRIIMEDLNPVYEETAVLLLTLDEVRCKEEVCAMLWDSDKMSADDLVGRVQIPVEDLIKYPNKMFKREDGLMGFDDENEMPGKLVWSIGYFEKAELQKHMERMPTLEEAKADEAGPSAPSKEMRPDDAAPNPAREDLPPPPPEVGKTRPDPQWPSGVVSIVLHQINNLERQNLEGKSGEEREGEAGQDTDDPSQQTTNLPSAYGEFILNDELIYRTRVKQYSTNPYIEAGTEVFIRDFTRAEVRVVIRDSRLRENDPILGVVSVYLADVFAEASAVTQTYPITDGQGFGKANISFAFRGIKATLPPNLRGWNTGTVVVSDVHLTANKSKTSKFEPREMALKVHTTEWSETMSKRDSDMKGDTISWDIDTVYLPVYNRYQSSVLFEFGKTGLGKLVGKGKPEAIAVLWLQDLTDDIEGDIEIPVIVSPDLVCLRQNIINDQTLKTHKFEVVGTLKVRLAFSAGIDLEHEKLRLSQSRRHAVEAYYAIEGEAEISRKQKSFNADGHIDRHEQREIDKAHRRALESRGRGKAQVGAYRSAKWMGRGILDRLPGKKKTREPSIQTEA